MLIARKTFIFYHIVFETFIFKKTITIFTFNFVGYIHNIFVSIIIDFQSFFLTQIYFIILEKSHTPKIQRLLIPNLDLTEKIGKVFLKQNKFLHLFAD